MIIYFVRHGETIWNRKGITQGHKNSPLTLKGKNSAKKLGEKLRKENIEKIYSSDLGRCVQTAEIINRYLKVNLIITREMRERNFGDFNGYPAKNIRAELDLSNVNEKAPNGESFNEMKERVIGFIRSLTKEKIGKRKTKKVLLVTHEGPTRAILSKYYSVNPSSKRCDASDEKAYYFEIENNTIIKDSLSSI